LRAITGFLEASSFGGTHLIREFKLPWHPIWAMLPHEIA
jgi:hypothetical protein